MNKPLIIGNWKMHGTSASSIDLASAVVAGVDADGLSGDIEIVVLPPALFIPSVADCCAGFSVLVGAQNVAPVAEGACTGELSAGMLTAAGCRYALTGHSERRQQFAETDALIAARVLAALDGGLSPVLCVGETLAERDAGQAEAVIAAQLDAVLDALPAALPVGPVRLVVAYEPVWAIGTGLSATPEQAQAMHAFIRGCLARRAEALAVATPLLYGGSVKPDTAGALLAMSDIDGLLVGGASLVADDFLAICRLAYRQAVTRVP